MHGVSPHLNLSVLRGAQLIQICLGQHQVQFHFHPIGTVSIEGKWSLYDADRCLMSERSDLFGRRPIQLHRILGQHIQGIQISPPDSLTLRFDNGESLQLFDSCRDYESIQIEPGGIVI